jgi:hemolysin activation/secretion protein
MKNISLLLFFFFLINITSVVYSDNIINNSDHQYNQQLEFQEKLRLGNNSNVNLYDNIKVDRKYELPQDENSFYISHIELIDDTGRFKWLQKILNKYDRQKIGKSGLTELVKRVTILLANKGFATTRINVPQQSLSTGILKLKIIPGYIGKINVLGKQKIKWSNTFPIKSGDILNYRNLEQGVEQIQRLQSQQVKLQIIPSENSGESDINIYSVQGKNIRGMLIFDDSGDENTGRYQSALNLTVENPLNLSDTLDIYLGHDLDNNNDLKGTKNYNINYTIPYKKWLFSISKNHYFSHQSLMFWNFAYQYNARYDRIEFMSQYLLNRDASSKTSGYVKISKQKIEKDIDGIELILQGKNVTNGEVGIMHKLKHNASDYNFKLGCKFNLPWFNSEKDAAQLVSNYRIWQFTANMNRPFKIGKIKTKYKTTLSAQYATNNIYPSDEFTIGGRYSVRGFDGKNNLSGENGFYWQNEITFPSGEMQLISQGDITNYGSISADNNLTFTASGDVNFVPLTAETELPLVISGKKIAISCNNFLSNADVGSLHDTGVADENARAYGIDIDALGTATIYGNLVSNNGAITVDADQAVIQDAVITSVSPLTSEGFDVTVITNGSINVTNSKLISEKGLKLDSNDKGEIYILNSQITNNGTGPCSFFAQPKITVDNSAITGKGMVALNANYVDIKGLKSSLTSGGDMMIFAFTEIKNTGELISNGYLNMVMSNYGKFNNMGVMLSKDYLQIYGSPVFQNLNILGSQSDISLWGRNAGAAYTGVKAPIVKVNGYDMGLAGNIYALFSPSDLTVKYVIAGIGEVAPGGYGTIGSAASSAYNCYKNNYSEPTTQAIISDTGEFITIEVGKQLLKKAGVVGSGPVIGAALVLKDAIRYEDYSISLDRKFGAYDVLTGDRVLQGGLTDALKFFDKVAGSDKGWQETVNADGIITRVSPDGSVTATLKMPTETQANPIVEFRGSGTEVKYLPYCSDQTVKFI